MAENDVVGRVISGATWEQFCDALKAAGKEILRPETPATELDRAEGWRYLTRLTRVALEMMLEFGDPDFPVLYQASNTTIKIGGDNPDNVYWNATIAGDREYRLRGTRGTVKYLSFATKANRYAIDGTLASTGELDSPDLKVNPDGTFEVLVSAKRQSGNWLPMSPDSSMLLVRNTLIDRKTETPAIMTIERIGGPAKPPALTAARIERALLSSAAFVKGTAHTFADWVQGFQAHPNQLATIDQSMFFKAGGDPNIFYLHGYWSLKPDEALVIEVKPPQCEYWNFQLDNYWMESLDYRHVPVWVNSHTAKYNADGSATLTIARENRGFSNWLDTDAHTTGSMLLRWTRAKTHPVPKVSVVKLDKAAAA
ncbi:MAG: DUF1214 domain-containing protein [Proteobacteria bacterium]|nr:DUF1214 domain-containing protein [Pseudomonadota bacterium]